MTQLLRSLQSGFLASVERFPDRPALAILDERYSYRQLHEYAASIAATIQRGAGVDAGDDRLTGVFGHRSQAAFAGVLAGLYRGDGYVPLNPMFPAERTRAMVIRANLRWIVAEAASLPSLAQVLDGVDEPLTIVVPDWVPDADDADLTELRASAHNVVTELAPARDWQPVAIDSNALAYLLFTSGSTGQPKGVGVSHRNVTHFVDVMAERYAVTEHDRFSQTFDLTFDLSAFDMFVAWERGACVCCPTQQQKLFPAKYIDAHGITIWFSVPSTAVMMKKLRMLPPDRYPTIRYSLFCGEALPLETAETFQESARASTVENLYGPTELTIACTLYRFTAAAADDAVHGVVPIGEPYPGMRAIIVDEALNPVQPPHPGELLMTGPQLSLGYWQDPDKTAAAFVAPPGETELFYRTGDRVMRQHAEAPMVYLGRMDNQIKVQGYRVELGEIEAVMREQAVTDTAIAVGFPEGPSGPEGIVGFISMTDPDLTAIRDLVCGKLPSYMQPSEIRNVDEFPLNANGKVDRKALLASLNA